MKVGGSLLDWPGFPRRLDELVRECRSEGARVALVAGGGPLADWVREADRRFGLGEEVSHHLAIRSLDLSAYALAAIVRVLPLRVVEYSDALRHAWHAGEVPILLARTFLDEDERSSADPLPHTWEVTSDSIAARLAVRLGAELWLLKSADFPESGDLAEAASLGLVDPAFPATARSLGRVLAFNLRSEGGRGRPLRVVAAG